MTKTPLNLDPIMGERIVHHLSALGPLPEEGYLAGQAVSSAFFELFVQNGEGLSVYNDLDVFYHVTKDDEAVVRKRRRTLKTVQYHDVEVREEYGHLNLEVTRAYEIVRSHRSGLLNLIAFDYLSYGTHLSQLRSLLQGFDMNCTQIGVSLATKRLEWTPAFAEFANSHQLRICNVQTPHHTAMRWFKKRRELPGAYGRDDDAMELVSLLSHVKGKSGDARLLELDHLRWRFGGKNADLYQQFRPELAPYFDLVKDGQSFFYLNARQQADNDMVDLVRTYPTRSIAHVFNELRMPQKPSRRARAHAVLCRGPSGKDRRVPLSLGSYLDQGRDYLAGNVDTQALQQADRFAALHQVLVPRLWKLSAAGQIAEHAAWDAISRRHGDWIYGYVEARMRRHDSHYIYDLWADTWGDILDRYAMDAVPPDTVLVSHPRFEATLGEYVVRELITRGELLAEGDALHHCVGGYAVEVQEKRSRILQIRHTDKRRWSTLEIGPVQSVPEGAAPWTVLQHLSFCNDPPHAETASLVDSILMELAYDAARPAAGSEHHTAVGATVGAVGDRQDMPERPTPGTETIEAIIEESAAPAVPAAPRPDRAPASWRARFLPVLVSTLTRQLGCAFARFSHQPAQESDAK
jgi:hypothetical protein